MLSPFSLFAVVEDQWWYTCVTWQGYFLNITSYQTEWKLVGSVCKLSQALGLWMLTTVIARLSRGHLATRGNVWSLNRRHLLQANLSPATFEDVHTAAFLKASLQQLFLNRQHVVMNRLVSSPLRHFQSNEWLQASFSFKLNMQTSFKKSF